jgi:hypothetical protein
VAHLRQLTDETRLTVSLPISISSVIALSDFSGHLATASAMRPCREVGRAAVAGGGRAARLREVVYGMPSSKEYLLQAEKSRLLGAQTKDILARNRSEIFLGCPAAPRASLYRRGPDGSWQRLLNPSQTTLRRTGTLLRVALE